MLYLADENTHAAIVSWLRNAGDDVASAAESLTAEPDVVLLRHANDERRVLITSDRDFGELVFYRRLVSTGIILLRLDRLSVSARLELLRKQWLTIASLAPGRLVVVSPGMIRSRALLAAP